MEAAAELPGETNGGSFAPSGGRGGVNIWKQFQQPVLRGFGALVTQGCLEHNISSLLSLSLGSDLGAAVGAWTLWTH